MAIYNSLHISPPEQNTSNTDKETSTLANNSTNFSNIHILNINPPSLTSQSSLIRASSDTNLLAIQKNDSHISRGFNELSEQRKDLINNLKAQPADAEKWLSLTKDLHHGEFVSIGNNLYNNAACYLQPLRIDSSYTAAWIGLSSMLYPKRLAFQG